MTINEIFPLAGSRWIRSASKISSNIDSITITHQIQENKSLGAAALASGKLCHGLTKATFPLHHSLSQQSQGRSWESPMHPSCNNRTSRALLGAALASVEVPFCLIVQDQFGETSSHWFSSILRAPRSGKVPARAAEKRRSVLLMLWMFHGSQPLIFFFGSHLFLCTSVVSICLFSLKLEQI